MILVDNSIDVAAFIAKYVANKNQYINLTKLQKLMYCVYGAVLAFTGDHICKEHPKAWEHGPVFCKLYDYAKKHCELIEALLHHDEHVDSMISDDQIKLIDNVLEIFSEYNAGTLVNWSCHPNGPWRACVKNGKVSHKELSDELIIS